VAAAAELRLAHCSPVLRILLTCSEGQSWEIEIDGRFVGSLRRDYEIDFGGSRNAGCDEGCESGVLVNEIFPSVKILSGEK
jgi:hypothetical protein